MNLEEQVKCVAEKAVLKFLGEGHWLQSDYSSRIILPKTFIDEVWTLVDKNKIKAALAARIEVELAERVVNHLAAEMATDIKQILGVPERREALRAVARQHLNDIMLKGQTA